MRREAWARAAWIVPAVCAALLLAAVLWERWTHSGLLGDVEVLANVPLSLGFALVGALIVSRRPDNRLGRLYLGSATAMALTAFVYQYAQYGLVTRPGSLPGASVAAWVSSWIWALGFAPLFTLGLLLYPDGRVPSPRWRWLVPVAVLTIGCLVLPGALMPGPFLNHPVAANPIGIEGAAPVLEAVGALGFPLVLFGVVAGIAALAVRWRRAAPGGLERRQLVLLLIAATLCLLVIASPGDAQPPVWLAVSSLVVLALVPAAIGVAIVRHRLYEIDVVLNRSLVYAGLTGAIVVLYTALVWALGRPLAADGWATAVAVGIIGALVLPLRTGLQRLVDRAMYGDRGDPYAALSRLTARLQAAAAPGAALPALAEAIAASLRLPYVRVEVASGGSADAGEPRGGPLHELPLTQHGQQVGRLLLEGRDRRPVSARDLQLLTELARPAGAAVAAAALADALSASRSRLVQAREDERRRLRRDLHDGVGPTLAGVALGLDLVAARIDDDPAAARTLIGELKGETATAVDDVRRLVHGLRPPALDELGLLGALRQQTDRLALRTPGLQIRVDASTPLPPLRAATEVAAYRIALEAVTNSVRHAGARTCSVSLAADDALHVEVADDGVGIPEGTPTGVGLGAMSERAAEVGGVCTVLPAGRTGTRVVAVLPLDPR
ncbi:sensor histidine kinase [Blastococcus sp. CT_GayMR20]|uniref:sensor histidine kinase n=1 Tax=Blastococcus sp. CT_GayMR20 TaxID=2559609 RepID=UPI0010738DC1|nr:sensor histidine kinase [Blastococcus sp. CT_GayMR20]TFV92784.1 sensor histidine kinase [Blastococcus sp. CT_GayMR20]TFV92879.1 sensor histidine kinase [Blastococcus sp. CT_GayMR20]